MTSKAAWSSSFQLAPRRSSISSDDEGWEEHLRTTPDSVIIRSLRRRLWQAFMKEDDAVAVRCYTSTRPDWMRWMIQERNEKREKHQAIKGARLRGMIGHGACAKRSNEYLVKKSAAGRDTADSPSPAKLHGSGKCGLLELNMNPTDPFTADDFKHPQDSFDDVDDQAKEKRRRTNNHKRIHGHATARQAFSLFRFNTKEPFGHLIAGNSSHDSNDDSITAMTTPLHEAARLGNATLVRCMLAHPQVDCDVLNGQGRTILHCVAGGLTRSEAKYLHVNDDADTGDGEVGIRAPKPPGLHENENGVTEETSVKKAARAVSRLFRLRGESGIPPDKTACRGARVRVEGHEQHQLDLERMDVTTAVLRWTRPAAAESNLSSEKEALQPYDPSLSTGVSTNAVDSGLGRTALHYAAELGRSTLCEAILQSFYGTMLTIIDCTGRNPCELAAAGGFDQLAAYLEARALLYVDPYGTDEDLLAAITANESVLGGCVPPFGWFETLSVAEVQQRRERRIAQAKEKMRQIAAKLRIRQHARKTIHEYVHQNAASTNDNALVDETTTVTTDDAEAAVVDDEDEFFDVPSFEHSTLGGEARDAALVSSAIIDLVDDRDFSVFERLIHEGHVERFLSFHHWDIKKAFVDFTSDPFAAFQAAEVTLPRIEEHSKCADNKHSICLICCDEFDVESKAWKVLADCIHSFCVNCLQDYLAKCAKSKMGVVIKCPHHECESLLSPSEIYDLSSESEAFDKLLTSANDNFVVSASTFRFCPHPGCGQKGAVKINVPNSWKESKVAGSGILELVGAVCTNVANDRPDKGEVHDSVDEQNCDAIVTYEGIRDDRYYNLTSCVQPKRAHRFCFQCGEKFIHWPVRCEQLIEWKNIINKEMDDVDVGDRDAKDGSNFNDVAQSLWIKANTRPCPKCKAHIQKNDGCNHMTCSNPNCKHEFCWICRNDWKLHNTETGGFFRCNRWVEQKEHVSYDDELNEAASTLPHDNITDPRYMEITYGTAMHESRAAKRRSKDMARFVHHYARWTAHGESAALERQMGETVCTRLSLVVREAISFNGSEHIFGGKGLSFIHAAFSELLECRSMLQHSYAFSFFRYKSTSTEKYKLLKRHVSEKSAFEHFQSELELMTEHISDVVARSHIRATQTQIDFLTAAAAEKRKEFSNVMINILLEESKDFFRERTRVVNGATLLPGSGLDTVVGMTDTVSSYRAFRPRGAFHDGDIADRAVQESLEEFIANTGSDFLFEYGSDEEDNDWACSACTYVNAGGMRCDLCGSHR